MSEICVRCGDPMGLSEVISVGILTFCSLCAPKTEEEKERILKEWNKFVGQLTESYP
jgi:hypothetical protein